MPALPCFSWVRTDAAAFAALDEAVSLGLCGTFPEAAALERLLTGGNAGPLEKQRCDAPSGDRVFGGGGSGGGSGGSGGGSGGEGTANAGPGVAAAAPASAAAAHANRAKGWQNKATCHAFERE